MKNSSTFCLQAPKSSMKNLLKSTWQIQRENIKKPKTILLGWLRYISKVATTSFL